MTAPADSDLPPGPTPRGFSLHLPAESSVMPPPVTAPLEGLLAGLRLGLGVGAGDPEADLEALSRVDDWNAVAALARRHRVASLLSRGMQARAAGLASASGIEPSLKRTRERAVRHGLAQIAGLKRATGLLAAADIPCLVLKGLPLGQRLYGNPLARSVRDIDLLVSPRTFQAAERVLLENGWRRIAPDFPETPVRNRWYGRFRHDHKLAGPGGLLELHRRLSYNPFYFDAPFENLHAGSVPVEIHPLSFRVLGEEDEFAYLMCHGAGHYWKDLIWLCDMAAILASMYMEPERLERVSMRCRRDGLDSILASTLLLCEAAFHVRIPRGAALPPTGGRRAAWIAGLSQRTWGDDDATRLGGGFNWGRQRLIGLIAKPDSRTVLHEIASVFVDPRDWRRLDLPDWLFYLYFPLRPLLRATRRKGGRRAPPAAKTGAGPRFGKSAKAVRAFVRAPVAAKAMALEAALFLLVARLLVVHVPMRHWRRWLVTAEEPAPAGGSPADSHSAGDPERPASAGEHLARAPQPRLPRRVARIVRRAAHHVPFPAVCLPQAMALQWMLRRRGVASRLFFGARRKAQDSGLDFHAWLTVGGECVIGGGEVETYAPLPPFDGIGPRPG